ncbi:Re/Si-specific NAD(P)(+) transhydrogenase subunit alpha [Rhodovibrio salinarum]|uniref:NAD(P) transhydrogenase subunit alpha n=1 Tax=Rhodovibrio salinarum TaxID=1087 RepID=A0A934QI26_9PROT|nr:Re/Si-specific NAD(P)(+) transhydrogenase subunit alpha [Rhodovibrio salinarum]MBK1697426.1 NAD(P)(+) transhydrogenase (Re/Si-specific) subunit alpha [Rhodovibrio salinarum]
MKIAIPKERRHGEARVAASPDTVKKLLGLPADKVEVAVETGAGDGASIPDDQFKNAGATIAKDYASCVKDADVVFKVRRPIIKGEQGNTDELAPLKKGALLIGNLDPTQSPEAVRAYADAGVEAFAMEFMPRISRAQAMDTLSSQANLAGYRAVIDASAQFKRGFPMMMTAAGTVPPAKVLVMGAGVAGLQAIATARRLGGVVSATDVRPAAKEQVESLGASFVAVEDEEFKEAEAAGGYAKEMSDAYKKKQAELIADTIKKMDVVITTALIPGREAPKLVTADMVKSMKPGSIIVDLAVEQGGNCALSEFDQVVEKNGVTIVGYANWPSRLAVSASSLYARNLFNFLQLMVDKESKQLKVNMDDQLVSGTRLTQDGEVIHERVKDSVPAKGKGGPSGKDGGGSGKAASSDAGKASATKASGTKASGTKTSASKSGTTKSSGGKTSGGSKASGGKASGGNKTGGSTSGGSSANSSGSGAQGKES